MSENIKVHLSIYRSDQTGVYIEGWCMCDIKDNMLVRYTRESKYLLRVKMDIKSPFMFGPKNEFVIE